MSRAHVFVDNFATMEPYEDDDTDDEEFKQLLESTKKGLPNLRKVIDEWEYLNIQKPQVDKLEALYNMLDTKKLSKTKYRLCQSVMCSLYSKYHTILVEKEKLVAKNLNQLDECEDKTKPSTLNHYKSNHDFISSDGQHSIPSLLNINPTIQIEPNMYNHDPALPYTYKCKNDLVIKRDPRSIKTYIKIQEPRYRNFKEYREAKYGKEKYSNYNYPKNQKEKHVQHTLTLENEKFKNSNKTIAKELTTSFGFKNDTNKIKNYKIPKIKHKEELVVQNLKNDKTAKGIEIGPIKNNFKRDSLNDSVKGNSMKKTSITETIVNINLEKEFKTRTINDANKIESNTDKSQIINSQESIINIYYKDKKQIENKQYNIIKESIDQSTGAKKPKKCSNEKEFEKIVKEAASLNYDTCGPSTRTRSSLKKIRESLKKVEPNKISTSLGIGECSKNIEHVKNVETGQDVISPTSKETSEVVTPIEGECKNFEENIVSSNVINSTADMKTNQLFPSSIINFQDPGILSLIEMLKDEQKRMKLQEFLKSTDTKSTTEDKPMSKNMSHEEYSHIKQKKLKKKRNHKRNKSIDDNSLKDEDSNNAVLNNISDNGSNKEIIVIENSNSEIIVDHSLTSQDKVKLRKQKKSKENYGSFEIKDKNLPNTEFKDLTIVLEKYDKNKSSTSEIPIQLQTPSEPKHIEMSKNLKRKKPLICPLSVKLAREKLANAQNNLDENNQFKIALNNEIISKEKANKQNCKTKNKKIKTDLVEEKEILSVLAEPQNRGDLINESSTPVKLPILQGENSIIDQNSKKNSLVQTNINEKTDTKKTRAKMTELDKLHADISEMYDCDAVLNAPNIRHCRKNKQIDYCHTNTVASSKKNKPSTIEQLDYQTNKFISDDKVSKTKKQTNISKIKPKKKVYTYKKCAKKTKTHKTFKCTLLNRNTKNHTKTKKKFNCVFCTKPGLNNVSDNIKDETIQVNNLKVLAPEDFKDKSYFQTIDIRLECKLCSYNDVGLKIVRHYKEEHSVEEMLPSRLSVDSAKILINESVKENFGFLNVLDSKPLRDKVLVNSTSTCVFCHTIFYDITCFYDHITCHTGEYRYNCKMCKVTYPNVLELEKHISEHSNYDKSEGIFNLLHTKPFGSSTIFGYLCPFCCYVQLDYQRIVNHMSKWHFDVDQKLNSYWTIIRVNMSIGNDDYTNSIIYYSNLVGCLPPILDNKLILKCSNEETSVSALVVQKKKAMEHSQTSRIPSYNEDKVHLAKLNIHHSSPAFIPPCNEEFTIITAEPMIEHQEYTLKCTSLKCTIAGLSFELNLNSTLVYTCSASNCQNNPFSTVILNGFFKHINLNHQHIVWDRRCDMCNEKFEKIYELYLLKDALEHIISHHLVLKEIQQPNIISNVEVMEKGHNSPSIDSVKSKEAGPIRVQSPLRIPSPIRIISPLKIHNPQRVRVRDDLFSTADKTKQQIAENKYTSDSNNDEVEQTNSIEVSNNTISPVSPVSMLRTQDVRCLREREFDIFDGNVCVVEKNNQYEVLNPRSDIYLESGQHIVNNGALINGTYCLIDTTYQKNYLKKYEELGANRMKSGLVFKFMTSVPKLLGLFKCMDKSCSKVFSDKEMFKLHMQIHYSNVGRKKNNQINNIDEQFKLCAYCFKKFDNLKSLTTHISEKYSFCKYFCPYCFYRAYTPNHVLVHQTSIHTKNKLKILQLEHDEVVNDNPKEILMAVDYNDFVLPYKCNVGICTFSCFVPGDFIYHLNKYHQQCDKFCCYICDNQVIGNGFIALQSSLMIKHFVLHNINIYQCIYCLFGSQLMDSMMVHLAMEHFEYESICLERSIKSDNCDSSKIENLQIIKIEKPINNGLLEIVNLPPGMSTGMDPLSENLTKVTKKRLLNQSSNDAISKSIKSVSIQDITQSSKADSLKVPDSAQMMDCSNLLTSVNVANIEEITESVKAIIKKVPDSAQIIDSSDSLAPFHDNEFIMLDDDDQNSPTLRINDNWTENVNTSVQTSVQLLQHLDDDIITIDDDDDDDHFPDTLTETVTKEISTQQKLSVENLPEESIDGLNNSKRKLSVENLTKESFDGPNKSKRKHLTEESNNCPNTFKRSIFPIIELNKLFFCKKCDRTFSKRDDFQKHISDCLNWYSNEHRQCLFCTKTYRTAYHMTEHLILHGPDRFTCSLCNFNSPSYRSIRHHLRYIHEVMRLDFVPVNAKFTDLDIDEFIVYNTKDQQLPKTPPKGDSIGFKCGECTFTSIQQKSMISHIKDVHNIDKYEMHAVDSLCNGDFNELYEMRRINYSEKQIVTNRLCHNNFSDQPIDKKDYTKPNIIAENINIPSFSPDTVDNIPMKHIFAYPIGCSMCTYNTKVRSNLTIHLNGHKIGQVNTTKEIVNPVPSIGKSELMFDKMINLSASSFDAMNSEKITDTEQLPIQSNYLMRKTANNQEQQALESIDPLRPLLCRGIPIESIYTSKSRGVTKTTKSVKRTPVQAHKQKLFQDDFKVDSSLGTISTRGQFVCPQCNLFRTTDLENFREHLYKEINKPRWQCLTCSLISDSPKKMAWHVKKHGIGSEYEKIGNIAKLKWVERVIEHQHVLSTEFNKQNAEEDIRSVGKTIAVRNKLIIKTKKGSPGKKVAVSPNAPQMSGEIINLVDDSDDK